MKQKITTILLVIAFFYFSFMILDRVLSLAYGFNFQPYGPDMPRGFPLWGHIFNGSAAALGMFITFSLYDYGRRKNIIFSILAAIFGLTICSIIPYLNDAKHLEKHGEAHTLPLYIAFNAFYVILSGFVMYKICKTSLMKFIAVCIAAVLFFLYTSFCMLLHFLNFIGFDMLI